MNSAIAHMIAARRLLVEKGWIDRNAEAFRHLLPPAAKFWLGDEAPSRFDDQPLMGTGWILGPIGPSLRQHVDARRLDATDPWQRDELLAGLPIPGESDPADNDDAAPFTWAHRARCRQGLRLRVGGAPESVWGSSETIVLQLNHQPRTRVEAPLLVIDVRPGVHCVLVETHDSQSCHSQEPIIQNLQVHVRLGECATLQHLRFATPGPNDHIAQQIHVQVGHAARYEQALVATGSHYHLQRSVIALSAEGGSARSAGLLLAANSMGELQTRVSQSAACTTSAFEALALASGRARAVLNANARIAPGAVNADVRQRLTGIPTGGSPKLVLRPHLEIHHDQVQAKHGATWGELPEDALFYARQRGLDEPSARAMIIEGLAGALMKGSFTDYHLLESLGLDKLLHSAVADHLAADAETDHG